MVRISSFVSALLVAASLVNRCDAQATSTITETRTVIEISTVISDFVCAKLVNITGACLFRRGRLVEEPEILTFDEEIEAYVDKVYEDYKQFLATKVISLEPTVSAEMSFQASSTPSPQVASNVIESSISQTAQGNAAFLQKRDAAAGLSRQPRIYFSEVNAFFNAIGRFFGVLPAVTVTQTNVVTLTSTLTTGSSSSFILMGCTPSPFPYNVCPSRRRRSKS